MKEIKLKYRIICNVCNRPFDSRTAYNFNGHSICRECFKKVKIEIYKRK